MPQSIPADWRDLTDEPNMVVGKRISFQDYPRTEAPVLRRLLPTEAIIQALRPGNKPGMVVFTILWSSSTDQTDVMGGLEFAVDTKTTNLKSYAGGASSPFFFYVPDIGSVHISMTEEVALAA